MACCLKDVMLFDAMEHLRYVPVMVLYGREENGGCSCGELHMHIHIPHQHFINVYKLILSISVSYNT